MAKLKTVAKFNTLFTNARKVAEQASLARSESFITYLADGDVGYLNASYKYNTSEFAGVCKAIFAKAVVNESITEPFNPFKKGTGFTKMTSIQKMVKKDLFSNEGLTLATDYINTDDGIEITDTVTFNSQEELKEYLETDNNLEEMVLVWKQISSTKAVKKEVELTPESAIKGLMSVGNNVKTLGMADLLIESEGLTPNQTRLAQLYIELAKLSYTMKK